MDILFILSEPAFYIVLLCAGLLKLYRDGTSTFHVFSQQGIPGPKPLPYIGNLWGVWKKTECEEDVKRVKKYGKIFGIFEGTQPFLFIADPDIIKHILVKDFDHFVNHMSHSMENPILRKMVFALHDQEWKDIRASVSPAFTTGKIKQMSKLIQQHIDTAAVRLQKAVQQDGKIDAKRFFSIMTLGVIARCAFGLEIDNLGEKGDPFIENALSLFGDSDIPQTASILLPHVFPRWSASPFFTGPAWKFFADVVNNAIGQRAQTQEKYNDFLEICTESISGFTKEENGTKVKAWSGEEIDELIAAQALEFLIDGYETTAQTMSYIAYELAMHPDIQDKIYENVVDKLEEFGQVSHDMILEMPYVDQVIHEVLRMHPLAPRLDRLCNKDFSYKGLVIKKGMTVKIPVYYLHHSEEYFPDPETFNPDRWSPENKSNINTYTYLPFGGGPRQCMGSRFAMEQMKLAICTLVHQFTFFPHAETMEKMKYKEGISLINTPISQTVGVRLRQEIQK